MKIYQIENLASSYLLTPIIAPSPLFIDLAANFVGSRSLGRLRRSLIVSSAVDDPLSVPVNYADLMGRKAKAPVWQR